MKKLYNPELGVYFIDRNRTAFEHIMQYMASDKKIYQVNTRCYLIEVLIKFNIVIVQSNLNFAENVPT